MAAKIKFTNHVSPPGIAKFCWVNKADTGFDGKSEPSFKTRVVIKDTEASRAWVKKVLDTAEAEAKANGIKLKKIYNNPFKFPEDQDEDDFIKQEDKEYPKLDEDHREAIFFQAKSGFKPGLIDTSKPPQELPENVFIMGGDSIAVKVEAIPYEGLGSGVSLRLKVVQLVKKNSTFNQGAPDVRGFDSDEDGYKVPEGASHTDF